MKTLTPEIVLHEYDKNERSFGDIAKEYNTYANKVKRIYIKAGGRPRDRSEAQKAALEAGRSEHPTEGRERTEAEKINISESVAARWENLSQEEREARSRAAKAKWDRMSQSQKEALLKAARDAARAAATEGSKLERVIKEALENEGYIVYHQYDDLLENPKLRIDIFLPQLSLAIEVDGPSHFEPIWGEENFMRNKRADMEKTGLLISHNIKIIRLKNSSRHLSAKMQREAVQQVMHAVKTIRKTKDKLIEIEV